MQISRIILKSNTLAVWSRDEVARRLLLTRENRVDVTVFLWLWRVVRQRPVRGSQNLTWWSFDPETIKPLVGCQSQDLTSQLCPVSVASAVRVAKSKILRVVSSDAERNLVSLGAQARSRTASWCASSIVSTLLKLGRQYLISPLCPPETNQS